MKTRIFTLLLLALPFLIGAQTLTIEGGATVTVGDGGELTTGKMIINGDGTTDGKLTIQPGGAVTVTFSANGENGLQNNVGAAGIEVQSDGSGSVTGVEGRAGSLIFTNNDATDLIQGTVQLYIPPTTDPGPDDIKGRHMVGAPLYTGGTLSDFFKPGNPLYIWEWNTTDDQFVQLYNDENIFGGVGYMMAWDKTDATDNIFTFEGELFGFGERLLLPYDPNGENFVMIANPFPSSLNLTDDNWAVNTQNIELSAWIWDPNAGGIGTPGYRFWSISSPPDPPPPYPLSNPRIAMGQGLFVKTTGSPAFLDWVIEARDHYFPIDIYKKNSEVTETELPCIHIMARNSFNTVDEAYIGFWEDGSTDFENGRDVSKLFGDPRGPQVYMVNGETNHSINHLYTLQEGETRIVPLSYTTETPGEQSFTVTFHNMDQTTVYLQDKKTEEIHNLTENPQYTFEYELGENEDRFNVLFEYTPTGIEDPFGNNDEQLLIYAWDQAVYINNTQANFSEATIMIYDMYGRQVYLNKTTLGNSMRIPVNVSSTYLVVRILKGNEVHTKKVFIN